MLLTYQVIRLVMHFCAYIICIHEHLWLKKILSELFMWWECRAISYVNIIIIHKLHHHIPNDLCMRTYFVVENNSLSFMMSLREWLQVMSKHNKFKHKSQTFLKELSEKLKQTKSWCALQSYAVKFLIENAKGFQNKLPI